MNETLNIQHLAAVMPGLISGNIKIWHPNELEYPKTPTELRFRGGWPVAIWVPGFDMVMAVTDELHKCKLIGKGFDHLIAEVEANPEENVVIDLYGAKSVPVIDDMGWVFMRRIGKGIAPGMLNDPDYWSFREAQTLIRVGYNPGIIPDHLWMEEEL